MEGRKKKRMGKITKDETGLIFIDDEGNEWTEQNLTDAIRCLKDFKKFMRTFSYYDERLL